MSGINLEQWILPSWMACALINGDESGLSDEESALVEYVSAQAGHCLDCTSEHDDDHPGFLRWHDIAERHPFAADCALFTFDNR